MCRSLLPYQHDVVAGGEGGGEGGRREVYGCAGHQVLPLALNGNIAGGVAIGICEVCHNDNTAVLGVIDEGFGCHICIADLPGVDSGCALETVHILV